MLVESILIVIVAALSLYAINIRRKLVDEKFYSESQEQRNEELASKTAALVTVIEQKKSDYNLLTEKSLVLAKKIEDQKVEIAELKAKVLDLSKKKPAAKKTTTKKEEK